MSLIDVTYPAWMDSAACADSEADFFPEKGQTVAEAKAVCRECPVRPACLQWALDTGAEHGVFGGVSSRDRRQLRAGLVVQCSDCLRGFRTDQALTTHRRYCGVPESHGSHTTYSRGCRCEPCKRAHATYARGQRRRTTASAEIRAAS